MTRPSSYLSCVASVSLLGAILSGFLSGCQSGDAQDLGGAGGEGRSSESPEFAGVVSGEALGADAVELKWGIATDNRTPMERMIFKIYAGARDEPIFLGSPLAVSLPGARGAKLENLTETSYRFVVRAVDEEGNEDENISSVRVDLDDLVVPEFSGVLGAIGVSARSIEVSWDAASDRVSAATDIEYLVYAHVEREQVFQEESLVFETVPGAQSAEIQLADPETKYFIGVRARDEAGNVDGNERTVSTTTLEGVSPEFGGVVEAKAVTAGIELSWVPATDNADAASQIVYEVFVAKESGGQNLLAPYATTPPGVVRYVVTGLEAQTEYFFIVRARDRAKNTDDNTEEIKGVTLAPDVKPPVFAGVETIDSLTPGTIHVEWSAASDDRTAVGDIVYEIFVRKEGEEFDFSEPHFVTPRGRTSAELLKLARGTDYFVVVRARDEAKNIDENEDELGVTTLAATDDDGAPVVVGELEVERVDSQPEWLAVSWAGLSDDTDLIVDLRVHVCVGKTSADCTGSKFFQNLNVTSEFNALSVYLTGLDPRAEYFVAVRPEDSSGNLSNESTGGMGTTATSFAQNVKPVLESRCSQCHSYDYGALVQVASTYEDPEDGLLSLVSPGLPSKSYFLRKLRPENHSEEPFSSADRASYEGERMPSDGTDYLSSELESILFDWVSQGAHDD